MTRDELIEAMARANYEVTADFPWDAIVEEERRRWLEGAGAALKALEGLGCFERQMAIQAARDRVVEASLKQYRATTDDSLSMDDFNAACREWESAVATLLELESQS